MSRGGRGAGRGGFGGRSAFGANNPPPMGLTFADIQAISREQGALYPPLEPLPALTEYSDEERRICDLQRRFAARLRRSAYYVTQVTKSTELERYADKYRPAASTQPRLERRELHQPFFPQEVFEAYFDPRKKRLCMLDVLIWMTWRMTLTKRINRRHRKVAHKLQKKTTMWTRNTIMTMQKITLTTGRVMTPMTWEVVVAAIHLVGLIMTRDFSMPNCSRLHSCDVARGHTSFSAQHTSHHYHQLVQMILFTFPILLLTNTISVFACEGDCIIGITRAWQGNLSSPVDTMFKRIAQEISRDLLPGGSHHDSMQHLNPIATAYQESSYDGMRTAIFPGYFHGKCQRNGANPPGCPNPDCPVVCGTPGSLVHFFPTLRFIAFNYTRSTLQWLCSPGNDAYVQTERSVVQAAAGPRERRRVLWFEYAITRGRGKLAQGLYARKREEDVKKRLGEIMSQVPDLLEDACGGYPSEDEKALSKCSWESMMKAYILSFP